jgi:hypothetical protein
MKSVVWRMLQAPPRAYFRLLLVAAVSLPFFLDAEIFAWRSIDWIRNGFLVVFVDSENFITGCF